MLRLHIKLHLLSETLDNWNWLGLNELAKCDVPTELGAILGHLAVLTLTAAGSVPWEEILQNPAVWSVVACHAMSDLARNIHDEKNWNWKTDENEMFFQLDRRSAPLTKNI